MSALTDIRLAELQFTTNYFISDEPVTISLLPSRGDPVQTATGGHNYGKPANRAPQTFRVVRASGRSGEVKSGTDGGVTRKYNYVLVGSYDAVVAIGDTWDETAPDGTSIHYHVDDIEPFNGFEVRAQVTAFATEPQHGG